MAKRTKAVTPPRDANEADRFLAEIGQAQTAIDQIEANLNEEIDRLRETAVAEALPHRERIDALFEGLYAYAAANKRQLTENGARRTVALPSGSFGWRTTPKRVNLRSVEKVLASCTALGLQRFIRTKEEVDKEAMLREEQVAVTVDGVTIKQGEEFFAKPETVAAIACEEGKLRKRVR